MQVGRLSHGSDFPVAEEASNGHARYGLGEELGVVPGPVVEVLAAAQAGKQQRPGGARSARGGGELGQALPQVLGRGGPIPQMETQVLPGTEHRPHGQQAPFLVHAEEIANQVASSGEGLQRMRAQAQKERAPRQDLVRLGQRIEDLG